MTATLVTQLANTAHAAPGRVAPEVTRPRLLGNLAAAIGASGGLADLHDVLGPPCSPQDVAHRLAAAMHARTQDDFYPQGRCHVGAVALPAALAVGAPDVHAAAAAGYEVMARVSEAYSAAAQERGWRPTGVFGPIGAAAAAAVGLGLDEPTTAHALALSTAACGGTNQSWLDGSGEWLLEVAAAARSGVEAALLARAGHEGAANAFEGVAGWGAAVFDDIGASALRRALSDDEPRVPLMAMKPYPLSGIAQAPTAAACALHHSVEDPAQVEVRMSPAEAAYPGTLNRGPFRSRADALMSVARCVVVGLRHGRVTFASLTDDLDPADVALVEQCAVVPDPTLAETEVVVRVTSRSGEQHVAAAAGRDLLYPSWDELTAGDNLARQFEVPEAAARDLIALVGKDAGAPELLEVLAAHLPGVRAHSTH